MKTPSIDHEARSPAVTDFPANLLHPGASGLEVAVYRSEQSEVRQVLGSEAVTEADFQTAIHEAWRDIRLANGALSASPDGLPAGIQLVYGKLNNDCLGFLVVMPKGNGDALGRAAFPAASLGFVAERCVERLRAEGRLEKDEAYHYRLVAKGEGDDLSVATSLAQDISDIGITIKKPPLSLLRADSLNPLLDQSTHVTPPTGFAYVENPFQVFYTRNAYERAERFCRKGAVTDPLHESGCVLAGSLGYATNGGLFVVVEEAYEVRDADQTLVSLTYSGRDWQRILDIVRLRQLKQPHFRVLGQAHAHNFIPNNGECCAACPTRETCDLTNLYVSSADQHWHRAIFPSTPWALCHIFALSARCDLLNGLFTVHRGLLSMRPFRLLDHFDPSTFSVTTTA